MTPTLLLLKAAELPADAGPATLVVDNTTDPLALPLDGIDTVVLSFPRFTDGRAFSQAYLLRRRRGFAGQIRAVGDVLIDQLVQMQRSGFSQAVLRDDQDAAHGQRLLAHFSSFYQGDATDTRPRSAQREPSNERSTAVPKALSPAARRAEA